MSIPATVIAHGVNHLLDSIEQNNTDEVMKALLGIGTSYVLTGVAPEVIDEYVSRACRASGAHESCFHNAIKTTAEAHSHAKAN